MATKLEGLEEGGGGGKTLLAWPLAEKLFFAASLRFPISTKYIMNKIIPKDIYIPFFRHSRALFAGGGGSSSPPPSPTSLLTDLPG